MECKYFGQCGACRVYEDGYEAQLAQKHHHVVELFKDLYCGEITLFRSQEEHYRARSEFKIWHDGDAIYYAMNHQDKGVVCIDECPQVALPIAELMPKLLKQIVQYDLGYKLFGADFLSGSDGDMVVSLLYHRQLDEAWDEVAKNIANNLHISLIGRARKQKRVIGKDYVTQDLMICEKKYSFEYIENSFSQPNPHVNEQMITWALTQLKEQNGDLLELYCGAGNFTIPFATHFRKVLATEISKSSIHAAQRNMQKNGVTNIEFVRMAVEDFRDALDGVRVFRRMKGIDISSYDITTIFVDPPRSGMDEDSAHFCARYNTILYISCNPETLQRDLKILTQTHTIVSMALFDQFPYTHHVEMGVMLVKKSV